MLAESAIALFEALRVSAVTLIFMLSFTRAYSRWLKEIATKVSLSSLASTIFYGAAHATLELRLLRLATRREAAIDGRLYARRCLIRKASNNSIIIYLLLYFDAPSVYWRCR